MNQEKNGARWLAATIAGLLLTAVAARGQVAEPSLGTTEVVWRPLVDHEGLVLVVSGPRGTVVRAEGEAGGPVSFSLFDRDGGMRPDGTYVWELRALPVLSKEVREELEAARASGDERRIADTLAALRRDGKLPEEESLVQVGSFAVLHGTLVSPDLTEGGGGGKAAAARAGSSGRGGPSPASGTGPTPAIAADLVFSDDLIVRDSLCVGGDCVNNESFGLDTLRLRENNLRIHFEDTSTSPGFAANDWRLIVNDSFSGGSSRFSVGDVTGLRTPFTVSAGAPSSSLFIDPAGRVGFRTATPVRDLHASQGNTPALRLEQHGSGGFSPQTWDVGGNELNFFVRDVTGSSRLPLRIRPGAPTSSLDIGATGRVGFGTVAPQVRLDALGGTTADSSLQLTAISATEAPQAILRHARAASGAPAATRLGDVLGALVFGGHDGAGFAAGAATISSFAEQNWSAGATGAALVLATAAVDTAVAQPRLTVRQHGAVGIGTTKPTELLHVAGGNVLVSGGSFIDDGTTLNVPDYVFERDYDLMPLGELAEFVEREGHLPNVPSRDEVRARGLALGPFQMRLLEKIEELALYAITQHGALQAMREENAELRARLAAVERAVAAP